MALRIGVLSTGRSDFGLLEGFIDSCERDPEVELKLFLSGSHVSASANHQEQSLAGRSFKQVRRVEILVDSSSRTGAIKGMGLALISFSEALVDNPVDLFVILGDRFEMFACAQAAFLLGIPLAHIHGGEVTEGAFDDSIRHATTKLSHLHFVSSELHAQRVSQLGESEKFIFNVGAPGLDQIRPDSFLDVKSCEKRLESKLKKEIAMICYHPVTNEAKSRQQALRGIVESLAPLSEEFTFIWTLPNTDPGFFEIKAFLKELESEEAFIFRESLGSELYLSLLSHSRFLLGNSSSGIIEAPYLKVPTINMGSRQRGRAAGASVIQVPSETTPAISEAIQKALNFDFSCYKKGEIGLYGGPGASQRILEKIKSQDLSELTFKTFVTK